MGEPGGGGHRGEQSWPPAPSTLGQTGTDNVPREDGALAGGSARRGPRPDHQKPRKAECQPPLTTLRTPGPGPAGQLCRSEPETGPDRRAPDSTFPAAPLLRPAAPSRNLPRPSPRGPLQSPAPGRLRPVRHHQVRDAGAVVGELLVAGHAVDADDVDDGVLRADPHLALLYQHHAGLRAPRGPKPVGSRPRRPCPLPTPANSGPPLPGDHGQAPASLWSRFANRSTHGLASVCLDTVSHKSC